MMRPYPAYRDSGVEWLGEVPEGWEVARLKEVCRVFPSNVDKHTLPDEIPVALCNYTDVYYNDEITAGLGFMQATARPEEIEKFSLKVGDVIFTKDSETADDIGIAALVTEELPGVVCGYHLSIARPGAAVTGGFIKRCFDSRFAKAYFAVSANGLTRVGLGQSAINNLVVPLPPLPEQTAIAAFLDRETAKIDALVAEQRRLIALLQEKRQAVISHAVTRGLNPEAHLKPSGIDWLGDVPEGWGVVRIKDVARMESGHTPDRKVDAYWMGGNIPWVSLNDTGYLKNNEFISDTAYQITQAGIDNSSARLLPEGVVVFSRDATIGRCAITKRPMAVSQHFIAWVCGARVTPDFLLFTLRAMEQELDRMTFGATIKTIGMPDVRKLAMALPPLEEQTRIVAHIREYCASVDILISEAEKASALLQERRAALISAAVTGKIDVRDLSDTAMEAA